MRLEQLLTYLDDWRLRPSGAPLLVASTEAATLTAVEQHVTARYPDTILVTRTSGTVIKMAAVRAAITAAHHTSWHGSQLVLIAGAENLSGPATHALLKILEESPVAVRWLLTTRWPGRLPATIRSRVQQLWCAPTTAPASAVAPAAPSPPEHRPASLLASLVEGKAGAPLSEEFLTTATTRLTMLVRDYGPSPDITRALTRLRDYYLIAARGASSRAARDAAVAAISLVELKPRRR